MCWGDLTINYAERLVTVAGRSVHLSATEYKLLFELSVNAGRVLTHDQLLRRVWDQDYSEGSQPLAHLRDVSPQQAGRRREEPNLYLYRASRRIPHGKAGRMRPGAHG